MKLSKYKKISFQTSAWPMWTKYNVGEQCKRSQPAGRYNAPPDKSAQCSSTNFLDNLIFGCEAVKAVWGAQFS